MKLSSTLTRYNKKQLIKHIKRLEDDKRNLINHITGLKTLTHKDRLRIFGEIRTPGGLFI